MSEHTPSHIIKLTDNGWYCMECPARNEPVGDALALEREKVRKLVEALEKIACYRHGYFSDIYHIHQAIARDALAFARGDAK
jgi:hypothetical protein